MSDFDAHFVTKGCMNLRLHIFAQNMMGLAPLNYGFENTK
jgi:hypothetical protein